MFLARKKQDSIWDCGVLNVCCNTRNYGIDKVIIVFEIFVSLSVTIRQQTIYCISTPTFLPKYTSKGLGKNKCCYYPVWSICHEASFIIYICITKLYTCQDTFLDQWVGRRDRMGKKLVCGAVKICMFLQRVC